MDGAGPSLSWVVGWVDSAFIGYGDWKMEISVEAYVSPDFLTEGWVVAQLVGKVSESIYLFQGLELGQLQALIMG